MAARVGNEKGTMDFPLPCVLSNVLWENISRALGQKGALKLLYARASPFPAGGLSGLFPDRCMDGH